MFPGLLVPFTAGCLKLVFPQGIEAVRRSRTRWEAFLQPPGPCAGTKRAVPGCGKVHSNRRAGAAIFSARLRFHPAHNAPLITLFPPAHAHTNAPTSGHLRRGAHVRALLARPQKGALVLIARVALRSARAARPRCEERNPPSGGVSHRPWNWRRSPGRPS